MRKLIVDKELIRIINAELIISDAFCWEGSAYLKIQSHEHSNDKVTILLSVFGTSIVEHDGDIDGIKSQVRDLINKTAIVGNYNVRTGNTTCKIAQCDRHDDDDYEVYVDGTVLIEITKKV